MSKMNYIEAIQQAQDLAMEHDNNVFILGNYYTNSIWDIFAIYSRSYLLLFKLLDICYSNVYNSNNKEISNGKEVRCTSVDKIFKV